LRKLSEQASVLNAYVPSVRVHSRTHERCKIGAEGENHQRDQHLKTMARPVRAGRDVGQPEAVAATTRAAKITSQ
jgi:hypothetical protein